MNKMIYVVTLVIISFFLISCKESPVAVEDSLNVEITPSIPSVTDDLTCHVEGSGPYTHKWFKDDMEVIGHNSNTVPATFTAAGERWRCEVHDAYSGDLLGSDKVTISTTEVEK